LLQVAVFDRRRSFCTPGGPDGLEVLIFGPHVEGDGETVPDFWGED
jgi:hypothetical protein